MTTLAYIWPKLTRCPECSCWRSTRRNTRGRVQYRVCLHCWASYKVLAIGAHVDVGGEQSDLEVF